ncbi:MAG: DegQ family serine endoprotease [Pseudomonadota bacterium]
MLVRFSRALFLATLIALGHFSPSHAQDSPLGQLLDSLRGTRPAQDLQDRQSTNRRVPETREQIRFSFAPLVQQSAPSVVNIYTTRSTQRRSPFAGDPFFEEFFGDRFRGPSRLQSSLGSGVIVDESGLIVTNDHVIDGADEIRVVLSDGREFQSELVLRDERTDLAVLSIDARVRLAPLPFADSDDVLTGDLVLAIGNPFGVGQTITSGIVSATARTRIGVSDFGFFIQTDAAINPGNSGGALIDMAGRLIGINTAIFSRSGGSNGIGFAIPSNMVRAVVDQARGGADAFERPFIGASFQEVNAAIAESIGLPRPYGALVLDVLPDSAADAAGLRAGDVVLEVDGEQIEHPDALGYRLATIGPGGNATMRVLRRNRIRDLTIRLDRAPQPAPEQTLTIGGRNPFEGAVVTSLTPQLAQRYGLSAQAGALVLEVERGAIANRYGIRPGDVVLGVNGTSVRTAVDLRQATQADTRSWRYEIDRQGRRIRQFIRF